MATSTTSSARFLRAATPPDLKLTLLRMSGREELGRLPKFQLEFTSRKAEINPQEILGKGITWTMELASGALRYFNGYVTAFAEMGEAPHAHFEDQRKGKAYLYQAEVRPWLWFLTRAANCRVFQDKTSLEIAYEVFKAYPFKDVTEAKLGKHPKRPYSVQYRETDFNFVSRLFEEDGIYYSFEYEDGKNTMVLMDSPASHKTTILAPFLAQARSVSDDGLVTWSVNREIQPGKYIINKFDFENPAQPRSGEALGGKDHDLAGFEIFDYPAEYCPGQEKDYAGVRIEELHAKYEEYSGTGNLRTVAAGKLMSLKGHPRPTYSDPQYLLTKVTCNASIGDLSSGGTSADFDCMVWAIDCKTPFRPARVTAKPIIQGPQTAIVVGGANDEICTDELGRIKLMFHWDRYAKGDDSSSCWVRVAHPVAGNRWGFFALPRVGQEVVVEFLEGDPDRPLVVGSLYNKAQMPPYELPKQKTRLGLKSHSAPQGSATTLNELTFEDDKGKEQIYIQAEKDKVINIKNDRVETVGNRSDLFVKGKRFEQTGADHHVTVENNRNELIKGSLSLTIDKDLQAKITGKMLYGVDGQIYLKSGNTIVLEATTAITLKVGSNHVTIDQSGVTVQGTMTSVIASGMAVLKGGMVMINSGGSGASAQSGTAASPNAAEPPNNAPEAEGGKMVKVEKRKKVTAYGPKAQMFKMAAQSGTPFCDACNCSATPAPA